MIIDGIEFNIKEVILPISAPRPGNKLIGFDKSFIKNRPLEHEDKYNELLKYLKQTYENIKINNNVFDFYIPELNLYIDNRTNRFSNFNAYDSKNKFHQKCLNELIENNEEEFIIEWCLIQPIKRQHTIDNNINYLEIFDFRNGNEIENQILKHTNLSIYYSHKHMTNELDKIKYKPGTLDINPCHNKIILTYQKHFYKTENDLYKNPIMKRKIIENCMAYLYKSNENDLRHPETLRQIKIAGFSKSNFSHFSPLWIKYFIEKYSIKSIYDPCGGWGQRMVGAALSNVYYYYNDIDPQTTKNVHNMAQDFNLNFAKSFTSFDASEYVPDMDYEAVFTCPPYFKTEIYYGENTSTSKYPDLDSWLNIWWKKVIINSTNNHKCKIFAFVINNKYKKYMTQIVESIGKFELIEESMVGKSTNKNHFQRKAKNSLKGEFLLVYRIKE